MIQSSVNISVAIFVFSYIIWAAKANVPTDRSGIWAKNLYKLLQKLLRRFNQNYGYLKLYHKHRFLLLF